MVNSVLDNKDTFSEKLFEIMKQINPGISNLELYEFRYGMLELIPENGWNSIKLGWERRNRFADQQSKIL